MATNASTVFVKRLQSRAKRLDVSVTMEQCRKVYTKHIKNPAYPADEEMEAALVELTAVEQPEEGIPGDLAIQQPETVEITADSHPDIWETLQPEEPEPQPEPEQSALATTQPSDLSAPVPAAITEAQIQQAVEQQFGKESQATKAAIINYIAKDTFTTATELQTALTQLRQTKLDILLKLISDHNEQTASDERLIKDALNQATEQREQESRDFLADFQSQLDQMRMAFNV